MRMPLLLLTIFFFVGFIATAQNNNGLPFTINYNLPLKITGNEHTEKYDLTEYTAAEDVLQVKHYFNMTKEKARKLIDDRKFFLGAMFKDQPSPYPGVLSSTIGCPEALVPKPIEDTANVSLTYQLLATRNLIYGNCNPSDNYYYCFYQVFFCAEKKELFEMKIYTPISKPSFDNKKYSFNISCKN